MTKLIGYARILSTRQQRPPQSDSKGLIGLQRGRVRRIRLRLHRYLLSVSRIRDDACIGVAVQNGVLPTYTCALVTDYQMRDFLEVSKYRMR